MSNVVTSLTFLKDLPLYKQEKPYFVLLAQQDENDSNNHRISNLEFEEITGIEILDLREMSGDLSLERSGFQLVQLKSAHLLVENHEQIEAYRTETEAFLRAEFDALKVTCWEIRVNDLHTHSTWLLGLEFNHCD